VDANRQVIKAMAMIQRPRDGAWLVSQHTDPAESPFQRPLGGHVEFGEYALDTVRREFAEEIGQELAGVRLTGVLENIFEYADGPHHEIVFVYRAAFADPAAYEIDEQDIRDEVGRSRVVWRAADATAPPLYPAGVAELVAATS
jgi:ADP-ribose pyrophosphatase YjhB (NUDIX family)